MAESRQGVVYLDGKTVPADEARISVYDHAVLYGDGIFETFRIVERNVFRLDDHLDRLARSAAGLRLTLPMAGSGIRDALMQTVRESGMSDCFAKLLVTRGAGSAPVLNHQSLTSQLIIIVAPAMPLVAGPSGDAGISAAVVATRKTSPSALDPRIKSLNYLNIIQSRIDASGLGADESILLDDQGRVVEASVYNIIAVRGGRLATPAGGCLEGITLDTVLTAASQEGFTVVHCDLYPHDLAAADEIILTSTAVGVVAVTKLNGMPVAAGQPGPIWQKLSALYGRALRADTYLTPIGQHASPSPALEGVAP